MPRGRPQASRLRQVETYFRNKGMAGLATAWAMARRMPKNCRKVDASMVWGIRCCSGVCPIPDLIQVWGIQVFRYSSAFTTRNITFDYCSSLKIQ